MIIKRTAAVLAAAVMLAGCGDGADDSRDESSAVSETETVTETVTETQTETETETVTQAESPETESVPDEEVTVTPVYDTAAIVEAYKSGDSSGLEGIDAEIYSKASEVLSEIIEDGMDNYEKELAVHDWMIRNVTYDAGALRAIPKPSEHSEDPYGAIVNGSAICMGYTTAFHMFMGMLDIPCKIIHSTDYEGEEHAWNAVEIDGSWYYADVTWDDPVPDKEGRPVEHRFFNVSKKYMEAEHVLTEDSPETDNAANSYLYRSAVEISGIEELNGLAREAVGKGNSEVCAIFADGSFDESKMISSGEHFRTTFDKDVISAFTDVDGRRFSVYNIDRLDSDKGVIYCFTLMELKGLSG